MLLEATVEKDYPGFQFRASFSVTNKRCGIFGPSGSGKSTLMNLLAGLVTPDQGSIRLDGITLFDSDKKINLPPEKRRVGVVFQQALLFPHLNVRKNLFYGLNRLPKAERTIKPDELIAALKLEPLLQRSVHRLSGGERQRVAIGRTILACPRLIILDEPLTGLDGTLKFQIIPYLRRIFETFSIPLLLISHSLQEMRLLTDEVLVSRQGKVVRQIKTEDLALHEIGGNTRGYINLLDLDAPRDLGDLVSYRWGDIPLNLVKTGQPERGQFTLNARDILLFKKHPEATSARNMLSCTVKNLYPTDWLVGVELDCGGRTLITEVVPQSIKELKVRPGTEIIAVFKASAFQRLC